MPWSISWEYSPYADVLILSPSKLGEDIASAVISRSSVWSPDFWLSRNILLDTGSPIRLNSPL